MENKTAKVLLVLALGTVVIWIVFRTKQALAAEPITIPKVPVIPAEPKEPKWQVTTDTVCYGSGNLNLCIPNPLGGLFKRADQVAKEVLEVTTAVASNLGKTDEVPVGNMLNSVLVMVLDSSGDRSDSYVTDMGIKFPKQVRTPFESKWYELKARMRALYNLPSDLTGIALIPLQWVSKRAIGIDLSAAMTGDVKLGFTIATASGTLHILYFNIGLA